MGKVRLEVLFKETWEWLWEIGSTFLRLIFFLFTLLDSSTGKTLEEFINGLSDSLKTLTRFLFTITV